MIILNVRNGLGNQMFIYAFGVYLQEKYNQEVVYDLSELEASNPLRKSYDINDIFCGGFKIASNDVVRKYLGKPFYFSTRRIRSFFLRKCIGRLNRIRRVNTTVVTINEPNYYDVDCGFVNKIKDYSFDANTVYFMKGFWENTSYINELKTDLKDIFRFKEVLDKENIYYEKIKHSNSVAVHIRRGDFLTESEKKEYPRNIYTVCDNDYYNKAIEYVESLVSNPLYFIFTDDPEYVEREYSHLNKIVVSGNNDYTDMQLITICKHCIIANSTFSFWGAMLNNNGGIVVAPRMHYIHMESDLDIYLNYFFDVSGWKYIEGEYSSISGKEIWH